MGGTVASASASRSGQGERQPKLGSQTGRKIVDEEETGISRRENGTISRANAA